MYASQRPLNNLRPPLFYSQNEQQKKAESGDAAMPSTNSRESTIGSSKRVYWQKKVGWLDAGGWPGVLGNGGFTPHLNSYITALL